MTWRRVKVSEFLTERSDRFSPDEANALGLQRVGKIDFSGNIHLVSDKSTKTGMILVKKGDLLISGINAEKGAVAIYDFEEDALATIHYSSYTFDRRKINITFLKWFLKSPAFKGILNSNVGSGIKTEIKPKRFLALEMYLPEPEEQVKIVNHIQAIDGEIAELQSLAQSNESLVTTLRQAILTEAVQGKLTAQWRKENPNQEPASELLKRIAAEKAWLIKEKKISKEKPLPPIKAEEVPYEVPEGWVWCRLGEVIRFMAYGTSQKTDDNSNNVPVLRMGNITTNGNLIYSNLKYINPDHKDLPKLYLEDGDIVFNRTNSFELVGKSGVFNQGGNQYTLASYLIKVTLFTKYVDSHYVNNYIISPICRQTQIEPNITAQTNQANFSGSKLKEVLFPICPLLEQRAIVQKINTLMAYCNELEQQVQQSKADLDLLMQAVLGEVFGTENQALGSKATNKTQLSGKETLMPKDITQTIYEGNALNMELLEILLQQPGGKIAAVNLWKMSKYQKDIDAFYEALKREVEENKTIKEADEKGWLELVAS